MPPARHELPAGNTAPLPENQHHAIPTRASSVWKALAIAIYICCAIVYIFVTSQKEDVPWGGIARLVVIAVWLADSAILFLGNIDYLVRYRLEIFAVFLFLSLILSHLLATMTDAIGITMASVVTATIYPELRSDLMHLVAPAPEVSLPL
ncbi:hypothetical protein B0H63DRAFT_464595 [Podospora didyma]|uniref:Uncharacterized protein n=1 Tax=Podospora didyma TaxID=330526 RepID=A0AAE0NYY0_9PEZI|nr:hypothetical protein B0H63DRAFT_464595 [Podospora didyma]